jgi:hypothetical protein
MKRTLTSLVAGVLLFPVVTVATGAPAGADAAGLTLSQQALGNVFVGDQQPHIGLATTGDSVSWTPTDAGGNVVASGHRPVSGWSSGCSSAA